MQDFAARFRALRKERGLTQKQMAEILGVGERNIGYYEAGRHFPDYKGLLFLADFFQVSLDYLAGRSDQR